MRARSELGGAVGPVEEEAEGHGFEAGEEGGHAVVDVVVGYEAGRGEDFAVEDGEEDLCCVVSLGLGRVGQAGWHLRLE